MTLFLMALIVLVVGALLSVYVYDLFIRREIYRVVLFTNGKYSIEVWTKNYFKNTETFKFVVDSNILGVRNDNSMFRSTNTKLVKASFDCCTDDSNVVSFMAHAMEDK